VLISKLMTVTSLRPADAQAAARQHQNALTVCKHATDLKLKLDRLETHIKRDMALHVPSCDEAEPAADAATCPEHCNACAFGTAANDPSRPAKCTKVHTLRCVQCAEVHSLQPEVEVLMKRAEAVLKCAESVAAESAKESAEQCVECADESEAGAGAAADATGDAAADAAAAGAAAPSGAAASAPSAAPSGGGAAWGRVSFEELKVLLSRAVQRVAAYGAHERRAAHEAKVMEKLLKELDDTGCIVVADWKMKFLASAFREAMADFFGKSGMCTLCCKRRRAHDEQAPRMGIGTGIGTGISACMGMGHGAWGIGMGMSIGMGMY